MMETVGSDVWVKGYLCSFDVNTFVICIWVMGFRNEKKKRFQQIFPETYIFKTLFNLILIFFVIETE